MGKLLSIREVIEQWDKDRPVFGPAFAPGKKMPTSLPTRPPKKTVPIRKARKKGREEPGKLSLTSSCTLAEVIADDIATMQLAERGGAVFAVVTMRDGHLWGRRRRRRQEDGG